MTEADLAEALVAARAAAATEAVESPSAADQAASLAQGVAESRLIVAATPEAVASAVKATWSERGQKAPALDLVE